MQWVVMIMLIGLGGTSEGFNPPELMTHRAMLPAQVAQTASKGDSLNMTEIGSLLEDISSVYSVAIDAQRNLCFIGGYYGVYILDISNPMHPVCLSSGIRIHDYANGLFYVPSQQRLYIAAGEAGLEIWDVSNPGSPQRLGRYDTPGNARCVYVTGGYAYVADADSGLRVIDVSNPTNPHEVGHYYTPDWALDVYVTGGYAYVADHSAGLRVIDVRDPAYPQEVGHYDMPDWAWGVYVTAGYAYVADVDSGLRVIDVSDPANPREVGYCDTPGWAYGVYVTAGYAYVADVDSGLRVIDVNDPANPHEVGHYNTPGYALGVYVTGGYAYVAVHDSGLRVIDVSAPANPQEVGHCDTPDRAWGVYVTGGYAYVADHDSGLRVIDVRDPANPHEVGYYDTPGEAYGVYVTGGYAYVADRWGGLRVIDISDPANPHEVGYCDTPGWAYGVYVTGGYAYVADGAGLRVIDVRDPANPHEVGYYDTPVYARGVYVTGGYAYVADYSAGLKVIDVRDPANPHEVGYYNTPGFANGVYVTGGYAYVADGWGGLKVIGLPVPVAVSPANGDTVFANPSIQLVWNMPVYHEDPMYYTVYFDSTVVCAWTPDTAFVLDSVSWGPHEWWVVAYQPDGDSFVSEHNIPFVIIDTTAPAEPTLIQPVDNQWLNNSVVNFLWTTVSKEAPVRYVFELYKDSILVEVDTLDTNGVQIVLEEGRYNWRVKAFDLAGNASDWSPTDSFGVDVTPPSGVELITPENNSILNTSEVTFDWSDAVDTTSGISGYWLALSMDVSFASADSFFVSLSETTLTLADTAWFWRVKAVDNVGLESDWSETWILTIDTHVPETPTLVSPVGGEWLHSTSVTFEWTRVEKLAETDAKAAPVYYVVEVLSGGSTVLIDTADTNFLTVTLTEGCYAWHVKAFDLAGNASDWSPTDSFGVDVTPPSTPDLVSPTDGFITSSNSMEFNWTASTDNLSGIMGYSLTLGDSVWNTSDTSMTVDLSYFSEGTYAWHVEVIDNAENFAVTGDRTLVIDRTPPSIDSMTAWSDTSGFLGPFDVYAWISDELSGVGAAWLFWSVDGSQLDSTAMSLSNGVWSGVIPAFSDSANHTVSYFVRAADNAEPANVSTSDTVSFAVISIEESQHQEIPSRFELLGVVQNPVKGGVIGLKLAIPSPCDAKLAVYDVTGRRVWRITRHFEAGYHDVKLRADLRSGVYFIEVSTPFGKANAKVIVSR